MQYGWALEFTNSNVCNTIGPVIFLITKNVRLTIYLSISLCISNSHGPSMYTLSINITFYIKGIGDRGVKSFLQKTKAFRGMKS